jgi:hypothetical protein
MRVVSAYIGQNSCDFGLHWTGRESVWCWLELDRMRVVLAYIGQDVKACSVGLHWIGCEMLVVLVCIG